MFIKTHLRSDYYHYLQAVEGRRILDEVDHLNLRNYTRGIAGEKVFYNLLMPCGGIKLWDLSIRTPALSQYDFLVIYGRTLFHFEIKNFSGHYRILNNQFVSEHDHVHHDVLSQLNRAHYHLQKILIKNGFDFKVVSKVVFINADFRLRGSIEQKDIIMRNGIKEISGYFDPEYVPDSTEKKLGERLLSIHQSKNIFERIYYYDFNRMAKGMRCPNCRKVGIKDQLKRKKLQCECGHLLDKAETLKKSIEEMMILKRAGVSSREVVEWTGLHERVVRRCLVEHFNADGQGKARTFTIRS
ncbi:nuclease-related domain-containing protein [Macrococcus bovicus]|nr:nuclease-related domain-containing protein [Macrococcus bovicus]